MSAAIRGVSPAVESRRPPAILFTAFEPSGDAHAAPIIAHLRRTRPGITIYAWGGPRMRAAGADLIESTGHAAAMGASSLALVAEHWRLNRRLAAWLADHNVLVHVPVDSPAANFPICELTRKAGCRIVHLVAPQMWAWGAWRVRRLRRLTDFVLCLLPFEEEFFRSRNVPAKFIGHPVLSLASHARVTQPAAAIANSGSSLPDPHPRLALLPGSRPAEITHNLRPMLDVFAAVRSKLPSATAVIAAADESIAARAKSMISTPTMSAAIRGVSVELHRLDEILDWADAALVCSGTATLDVTRHERPMVVMYRMSRLPWLLVGRWIVAARHRALPNLLAGKTIVPEFIPHFGPIDNIAAELLRLLDDPAARDAQRASLRAIKSAFANHDPASEGAAEILRHFDLAAESVAQAHAAAAPPPIQK